MTESRIGVPILFNTVPFKIGRNVSDSQQMGNEYVIRTSNELADSVC